MAAAFGVFAARGNQFPAAPVAKVTGPDGKVLEDNTTRRPKRVLTQAIADEMNQVLTGVVDFGTGTAANIARPGGTAGKTGTSEGFGDAWFVGYTPELSTSVWMGYADSRKAMENIKGTAKVFGGTLPAATWKDYMGKALTGVPLSTFPLPPRAVRPAPKPSTAPSPVPGPTIDPSATVPATVPLTGPLYPVDTTLPPYVPPFDQPITLPSPISVPPFQPFQPYQPTSSSTVPTGASR
jgi:penicillin-binding protein 1A